MKVRINSSDSFAEPITESLQKLAARRLDEELAQFRGKCDSEMKKFSEDPSVSSMRYPAATGPFRMIMYVAFPTTTQTLSQMSTGTRLQMSTDRCHKNLAWIT